jgi:hypothetical protein
MGKFLGPISGKTLCWIYEPTAREIFERCRILKYDKNSLESGFS